MAQLIPNQGLLINTLPLLEWQASSGIQNIIATADKLFQHHRNEERADPATKEALHYSRGCWKVFVRWVNTR